jgi:hypothetical protein
MQYNTLKKILLLSTTSLLLFACGNSEESEPDSGENENSTEETIDTSTSDENQEIEDTEVTETTDDQNSEENSTELTENEAKEEVIHHIQENRPEIESFLSTYQFSVDENNGQYQVNMFSSESADENIGSPLLSSYEVDRNTGEVQEIDLDDDGQSLETSANDLKTSDNPHMSELIDYSPEELRSHNEDMITHSGQKVEGQTPPEHFLEELMLPGIHENTEVYEGFAGLLRDASTGELLEPRTVSIYLNDYEPAEMDPIMTPDVDEEGYFVVDFTDINITAGDELYIMVSAPDLANQAVAMVEVSEVSEGMEHIYLR